MELDLNERQAGPPRELREDMPYESGTPKETSWKRQTGMGLEGWVSLQGAEKLGEELQEGNEGMLSTQAVAIMGKLPSL